MLNDASDFSKIYIATGYTDLRRGIDGLTGIIKRNFNFDPFQKNILFYGRKPNRIKGLLWEGDEFVLLYKRIECASTFKWLRSAAEASELSKDYPQNW